MLMVEIYFSVAPIISVRYIDGPLFQWAPPNAPIAYFQGTLLTKKGWSKLDNPSQNIEFLICTAVQHMSNVLVCAGPTLF